MRNLKIFNHDGLREHRAKNKVADNVAIFSGSARENKADRTSQLIGPELVVPMTNAVWEGSEGHAQLWGEIKALQAKAKEEMGENAAQAPSSETLQELLQKVFIDITRRRQESPDFTTLVATEIVDYDFPESITLTEFYEYVGEMQVISGANDSVPLMEQAFGEAESVIMQILAIGWKDSLKNMLFNTLRSLEKANRTAVATYTDQRNARSIGRIFGATYDASQKQAADTTSGATYDVKMYNTFRKAIKKLKGLKDPQTGEVIGTPSITVLCNSADTWDIERVINGQLGFGGGTKIAMNMQRLPINSIIEYDKGIMHGRKWGKKVLSYPGVTAGKAYIFVPHEEFYVAVKRPLTMETGRGATLQLSTEERAWYAVQTEYWKNFLGSSFPGAGTTGQGYVIEITLPSEG